MVFINRYVAHDGSDDLEKCMDPSSHHACRWVHNSWILRSGSQLDYHDWDEQCCRSYQEELYCGCHICGLLRRQCEAPLSI